MRKNKGNLKAIIQVMVIGVLMIIIAGCPNQESKKPIKPEVKPETKTEQTEMGLSGKVVTEDGQPFLGVSVNLSVLKEGYDGYCPIALEYPTIRTDEEGRYNFQNIEAGPFEETFPDGSKRIQDIPEPIILKPGTYKVAAQPPRYDYFTGCGTTSYADGRKEISATVGGKEYKDKELMTFLRKLLSGEMQFPNRSKETYYLSANAEEIDYKDEPMTLPDMCLKTGGDIRLTLEKKQVEQLNDEEIREGPYRASYSLTDTNGKEVVGFTSLIGRSLITDLVLPGKYTLKISYPKVFDTKAQAFKDIKHRLFKNQEFKDVVVSPGKTTQIKVPAQ